ncbi:MAG TPA: 30S ribosomal protein S12 methylthiotransferase RimO, partial [Acidimicrobiales bacterium]
ADLDWGGFFPFSPEAGTYAVDLDGQVEPALVAERLAEVSELQDRITAARRASLIGRNVEVLVDERGVGRTHREAPEIDGIVHLPDDLEPRTFATLTVTGAAGPDLSAAKAG